MFTQFFDVVIVGSFFISSRFLFVCVCACKERTNDRLPLVDIHISRRYNTAVVLIYTAGCCFSLFRLCLFLFARAGVRVDV